MAKTGRLTRAQIFAAFWAMFGFYMGGTGVKRVLESGIDVTAGGYLVFGVCGFVLGALTATHPDHVPDGEEKVHWLVEAIVVFALVFVGVTGAQVLFA